MYHNIEFVKIYTIMKIIPKLLVTVLMSALTSVVFAQTPTNKLDALKISTEDVFKIKYALNRYRNLWEEDSVMVEALLEKNNVPLSGTIAENQEIVHDSQAGDTWFAYISYSYGSYWLTYYLSRKNKFVGRKDIRID